MQLLYSFRLLYTYISTLSPAQIRWLSPHCPPILPVSSSRANSAWLPCGGRNLDHDDSGLTEAPHGALSTQLCGGQGKGPSRSGGRGRWQHRVSWAPDKELQGKKKEAYKSLIFKWAPTSPTNTQLPLAGRGHVIKKNLHTDEFFP